MSVLFVLVGGLGLGVSVGQAQSGSVEPPGTAVDGSGDPVATTQTQPSWDQSLPGSERFVRVLPTITTPAGEGVLDKQTGLVWEQSPQTSGTTWLLARVRCLRRGTGGQMGWRLPSIHELPSLVVPGDPAGVPDLPVGHPFSNVQSSSYWSATTNVGDPTSAWGVGFSNGFVPPRVKTDSGFVWCVRGGSPGPDAY